MNPFRKLLQLVWPDRDGGWIDGKWVPKGGWIDQGDRQMRVGLDGEREYREAEYPKKDFPRKIQRRS